VYLLPITVDNINLLNNNDTFIKHNSSIYVDILVVFCCRENPNVLDKAVDLKCRTEHEYFSEAYIDDETL
jgi:preprotein translocase subunit Sec63